MPRMAITDINISIIVSAYDVFFSTVIFNFWCKRAIIQISYNQMWQANKYFVFVFYILSLADNEM